MQREKFASLQHRGRAGDGDDLLDHNVFKALVERVEQKPPRGHDSPQPLVAVHHVKVNNSTFRRMLSHLAESLAHRLAGQETGIVAAKMPCDWLLENIFGKSRCH